MRAMVSTDMKQMNRKIVFDIARERREITRVELSELTGMSGPSIMAIVNEFVAKGILRMGEKRNGSVGRSPVMMSFNPDVMLSIGVEFEGNNLQVGLVNLDGEIRFQTTAKIPSNLGEDFFSVLCKSIEKIETMLKRENLDYMGIGLGIPGAVNPEERIVNFAPYVGVMEPRNISEQMESLERRFEKPVFMENDVNACAVGEYYVRRINQNTSDMIYISIGSGIGAGIILDGELRHGSRNMCGEIGYSLQDMTGTVSRKKTGWLEEHISHGALCERFADYRISGRVSDEMIGYVVNLLCPFISNLVNTLDIPHIVVGGQLILNGGERLVAAIRDAVQSMTLSEVILQGCHTEYTGVIGSALMASNKLWDTIL